MTEPRTEFSAIDHEHMAHALRLAARGLWTAHPNPRVGCVIAHGTEVVGTGWHVRTGEAHAEIHALKQAGARARGATAYVTLEPCSHHGLTAPCADALIEAGVGFLVTAMVDPYPQVAGRGLARLEQAGLDVRCGLMNAQARELNSGFVSRFERGRPIVRLKLAGSLDGRSVGPDGRSKWITGPAAREDGHRWRARAGAVLTGIGTVLADDPGLDVRLEDHSALPTVVIADSDARLPSDARVLSTGADVLIACTDRAGEPPPGSQALRLPAASDGRPDLGLLLRALGARGINEVHVESGPELSGALLAAGLVDELLVYQSSTMIGADGGALVRLPGVEKLEQRLHLEMIEARRIGADWRFRLKPDAART